MDPICSTASSQKWFRRAAFALAAATAIGASPATPACAVPFSFSTNAADGLLGARSQPAAGASLETEAADDFILDGRTSIERATIVGLVPFGVALADIENVEIEIYHVFPKDSAEASGHVPTRVNSPADVEIDAATRDSSQGTLEFTATFVDDTFGVQNTVKDRIRRAPDNATLGDGPANGAPVEITVTFNPPIDLPADHYFFRPEIRVSDSEFLFLSAPKPIVAPGTPFTPDLQAWIRDSALKPDWLRIGTDIIAGNPAPTFNLAFSLGGDAEAADTATPTVTPTATPTAVSTGTPTARAMDNGSGCNLAGAPSASLAWLLLAPLPLLLSARRR